MTFLLYIDLVPQHLFFLCRSLDISQCDSVIPNAFWDALCLFSSKAIKMKALYHEQMACRLCFDSCFLVPIISTGLLIHELSYKPLSIMQCSIWKGMQ